LDPVIAEHLLAWWQRAREELDVADELDAARDRRGDRRLVLGDAGLIAIICAPANVASVERAGRDGHGQVLGERRVQARIGDAHVRAFAQQVAHERGAGEAGAEDDDVHAFVFI
jgi:hypothetical protein